MTFSFSREFQDNKRLWIVLVIFGSMLLMMRVMSASSSAQSNGQRVLENQIPKHIPIKVKIKKEKEAGFKQIDNERWLRDFELELTNTGDKPIYYLMFNLWPTGIKAADGQNLVFTLTYGRVELGDIKTLPSADDVPIKPGETHLFKIHRSQVPPWEKGVRENGRRQPDNLELQFQILSFGDGTGYIGSGGQSFPRVRNKQSPFASETGSSLTLTTLASQ